MQLRREQGNRGAPEHPQRTWNKNKNSSIYSSIDMKIGKWNESDNWRDMYTAKQENIEITLKNIDMGVIGIAETHIQKEDKPEDI